MYIIFVQNVWICWKVDCLELSKFNGKLCTLNVRNVRICREIEYPELHKLNKKFRTLFLHEMSGFAEIRKFNRKLYTLYIYEMSGFLAKLNLHNYENSTGNCLHYICTEFLNLQKNWISRTREIQWEIVHIIYIQNVWISSKIESPQLRKFNGKLFTLYMYGISEFAEKLNIQN